MNFKEFINEDVNLDKTILQSLAKKFNGKIIGKQVKFHHKNKDFVLTMNDINMFSITDGTKHHDFKAKNLQSIYDQISMMG